jgi:hypothetical protein
MSGGANEAENALMRTYQLKVRRSVDDQGEVALQIGVKQAGHDVVGSRLHCGLDRDCCVACELVPKTTRTQAS